VLELAWKPSDEIALCIRQRLEENASDAPEGSLATPSLASSPPKQTNDLIAWNRLERLLSQDLAHPH